MWTQPTSEADSTTLKKAYGSSRKHTTHKSGEPPPLINREPVVFDPKRPFKAAVRALVVDI